LFYLYYFFLDQARQKVGKPFAHVLVRYRTKNLFKCFIFDLGLHFSLLNHPLTITVNDF